MTWDEYHLTQAWLAAQKSKDPSTKVGAVLVDAQQRVISTGYNGFPQNVLDTPERLNNRQTKLLLTIHAEENAILFAQRDLKGCTCYTWPLPPCASCAAKLIQVGVKRIVTVEPTKAILERWRDSLALSRQILHEAGVIVAPISFQGLPSPRD